MSLGSVRKDKSQFCGMTVRHPMYFIINNVRYKTYESYSRWMCFYQENCSLKIFQVGTLCGVYYVHLEHSNTVQNKSIFISVKDWKSNNYPCVVCKRQVSNVGFIEVISLV